MSTTDASAQARRVAIVNAAADQQEGAALARALRTALTEEAALAPLPAGELARALEEPVEAAPTVAQSLAPARAALERARSARALFDHQTALEALSAAERVVLAGVPGDASTDLLAEINFERALVLLTDNDEKNALRVFAAVRRLAPDRAPLDPARYLPEVVQAFEAAGQEPPATAKLEIASLMDGEPVIVDGQPAGVTPLVIDITPGIHYVDVVSSEYHVTGQRVLVADGERLEVRLRFERKSVDERARELRQALLDVPPGDRDEPFGHAARLVASLAGVDAVLLIDDMVHGGDEHPAGLATAVFNTRNGLSAWRSARDIAPARLVAPLLPPPAATPPQDPGGGPGIDLGEEDWYRRRWVQVTVGAGVIAAVVTFLALTAGSEQPAAVQPMRGGWR